MKAKVIKLLSQNRKVKDIAAEVGCTRAYVYYIKAKEFPELTRTYKTKSGRNLKRTKGGKAKTSKPAFTLIDSGTLATWASPPPPADVVNHPAHYTAGGIETYDYIVAKGLSYELGNVVKYVSRADHKGNKLEDLQKARWYLDAAIRTAGGAV